MIVSTVNGRVRVRARVLRASKAAARIAAEVGALPGVVDARPNAGAGCLTVTFDTDTLDVQVLEERIEALCQAAERVPRNSNGRGLSRTLNRATKYGMLATLTTSLAYGYLGRKKAHIGFGAAFLAFAGVHLFRYQGSLFR
ncbi:hypothetical protein TVNIR_0586 [Thioalkalivibrio nitratireducens DSM 14787]|uniref:Uncharacterized protein n=1 Tax=Thioalkalivibrio nitratireducens (strain DSM 14787 / UNIQEM 213 / ALEN2) TaxID=1255043 RepID=L0DTG2_THIND|nr:hypothetical protein [Thioalkalivibrio nitratireducens]AGA32287.1 hypothetical protein TVNIR_0586 [Thioalkalivibrio nitratireducens DSM 14787]